MDRNINTTALTKLLGTASVNLGFIDNSTGIGLAVPSKLMTEALADRGIDFRSLLSQNRFPHVRLQLTDTLLEHLSIYGIYGKEDVDSIGRGKGTGHTYYLELLDNGNLLVRYQQILGSWRIGRLDDMQLTVLKEIIGSAIEGQLRREANARKAA